jgi:hypothetical protein
MSNIFVPNGQGNLPAPATLMQNGYSEGDFSETVSLAGTTTDRIPKFVAGQAFRFTPLLFNPPQGEGEFAKPRYIRAPVFSKYFGPNDPQNVFFRATATDLDKECALYWDSPKMRWLMVVYWYTLDRLGMPTGGDVMVMPFGGDKYKILKPIFTEWDPLHHDIAGICTETQMAKTTMQAARERFFLRLPAEVQKEHQERAEWVWQHELEQFFPRVLPEAKIRQMMLAAQSVGGVPGPVMASNPFAGTVGASQPAHGVFAGEPGPANAPKGSSFSDLVADETQTSEK